MLVALEYKENRMLNAAKPNLKIELGWKFGVIVF